jgi:hypothetical protein
MAAYRSCPRRTQALAFWLACGFLIVEERDVFVTRLDLEDTKQGGCP